MHANIELLELAVIRLGRLSTELVFVGGCTTNLLITDLAAPEIRPTTDVDVIVEVSSYGTYNIIGDKLRNVGFFEDSSIDAPTCRWTDGEVLLDVMPTDETVLGYSNIWYLPAMKHAVDVMLPSGAGIKVITAPYFVATKLIAFNSRGNGDYYGSRDLEDIIAVVNGRVELVEETLNGQKEVKSFLSAEFGKLLKDSDFLNALPGHMSRESESPDREKVVRDRLTQMCN